jgi:hypothetical protein
MELGDIRSLELAILLEGWLAIVVPDILGASQRLTRPLDQALARQTSVRLLPVLWKRFPAAIVADGSDVLRLAQVRLDTLSHQADERNRWIAKLEAAKDWLDAQRGVWEEIANHQVETITEQAAWIEKLVEAKNWLDSERRRWERLAGDRQAALEAIALATAGGDEPDSNEP